MASHLRAKAKFEGWPTGPWCLSPLPTSYSPVCLLASVPSILASAVFLQLSMKALISGPLHLHFLCLESSFLGVLLNPFILLSFLFSSQNLLIPSIPYNLNFVLYIVCVCLQLSFKFHVVRDSCLLLCFIPSSIFVIRMIKIFSKCLFRNYCRTGIACAQR